MQLEQTAAFTPAITLLNMSGDVTITWDASNREAILELVRRKRAQGYSFFIVTPRFIPVLGNKTVELKTDDQLEKAVGVVVPDSQVSALLNELEQAPEAATPVAAEPSGDNQDERKLRLVSKLDDADVEAVVRSGKANLHLVPKGNLNTTRMAASAEEVLEHQTVAVRPITGG